MNKKQVKRMLLTEAFIIGTIGILLGIILGISISILIINLMQMFISKMSYNGASLYFGLQNFNIITNNNVSLKLIISPIILLFISITIYIIIFISCKIPIRKINKTNLIETIRLNNRDKISSQNMHTPFIFSKAFGISGEIAFKNIKREHIKHRTIVISLSISIIIFLVSNAFSENLFFKTNELLKNYQNAKYEYRIGNVDIDELETTIKTLKESNTIKDYVIVRPAILENKFAQDMLIPNNKISGAMEDSIKNGTELSVSQTLLDDGSLLIGSMPYFIVGDKYDEILNRAGLTHLNKNEVIITNTVNKEHSIYGDVIDYTKFKVGDSIKYVIKSGNQYNTVTEYKIAGIVDNFEPYVSTNSQVNTLLSIEILNEDIGHKDGWDNETLKNFSIYIDTDNIDELQINISNINEKRKKQGKQILFEENLYESVYSRKIEELGQRLLVKIPLYTFTYVIVILSMINIFNIVVNSISLRKREIAELCSIGMSKKQLGRMLLFEGIFYGLKGLIYGILISLIVLYFMYKLMIDTKLFRFIIHWTNILEIIVITYVIIFIAIYVAKCKFINRNIIEDIKSENI